MIDSELEGYIGRNNEFCVTKLKLILVLYIKDFALFCAPLCAVVAEWSKALRSGRNLFVGAGSNPADSIFYTLYNLFP